MSEWIPCNVQMPVSDGNEIKCLVTYREYNIFTGKWGAYTTGILSYSVKPGMWNTKADIEVKAWMPLPKPFG